MTSERKATSNRKNAQKSTGPRSEVGRNHSRRNALRHGLAVSIGTDPFFSKDIEALANILASGSTGLTVGEFARQAAEAEIDLLRIRKVRASRLNAVYSNPESNSVDFLELDESLAKLERYERRAISRRNSALLALIENRTPNFPGFGQNPGTENEVS
jgi:hypothetical protein